MKKKSERKRVRTIFLQKNPNEVIKYCRFFYCFRIAHLTSPTYVTQVAFTKPDVIDNSPLAINTRSIDVE